MREKFKPVDTVRSVDNWKYYEFEPIAMMLEKGKNKSERDIANFKRYEQGKITIEECMQKFKTNHHIIHIDIRMFKSWLRSLGWYRDE